MSITAQAGIWEMGFNGSGVKGNAVSTWYRYKMLTANTYPIIEKAIAPPEIGGSNNPTGSYKTGAYYAGNITLQPRLKGDIGWLLLWTLGQASSPSTDPTSGLNVHQFTQKTGSAQFIPFAGVRREVPGYSTASDMGEIGSDCIVSATTFNFPQVGPLSMDMQIQGRSFVLDSAPDLWPNLATEDYESVPMVMKGSGIVLPNWAAGGGAQLPITQASVTVNNNTTSIQEERIIGSYHPDDFAARQRSVTVDMTYKWSDPDLCRFIINNNAAHDNFAPCIETTDFELSAETPCDVLDGVTDYPWKVIFKAPKVDWQSEPLRMEGDDILMMRFTGTVLEADTQEPADYFSIELHNEHAQYSYPP